METIKGKIDKINVTAGMSKTNKPYMRYEFEVNNKKYSTFDEVLSKQFKVGDFIELSLEQSGKYLNVVGIKKIDFIENNQEVNKEIDNKVNNLILEQLVAIRMLLENLKIDREFNGTHEKTI